MMKALQFTLPVFPGRSVMVQEDMMPSFYPYLHRHKEAQLIWVIKGEGTLIIENSIHIFQPDDIFYLAPDQSHVFKNNTDGEQQKDSTHTISVFFDPFGQLSHLFNLPESAHLNTFLREYSGGFKLNNRYFADVSKKITALKAAENLDLLLYFLQLMRVLSEMNPKPAPLTAVRNEVIPEGEGLRMSGIYNYIMQHFHRDLSLDEVAKAAHLTPQAFCRYFKKHSGITFIAFLNGMRVNEACKNLIREDYGSISSVAYRCGFNSIPNFNRVFKNVTGASPKAYLARLRNNLPSR